MRALARSLFSFSRLFLSLAPSRIITITRVLSFFHATEQIIENSCVSIIRVDIMSMIAVFLFIRSINGEHLAVRSMLFERANSPTANPRERNSPPDTICKQLLAHGMQP